jgi:hypothetical protein
MDDRVKEAGLLDRLESQTDDALHALIDQAKSLLAKRQGERHAQAQAEKAKRQAQALAQIRQLAVDHGLHVKAKKRAGKRGRPRKADTPV